MGGLQGGNMPSIQTNLAYVLPNVISRGLLEYAFLSDAFYRFVDRTSERVTDGSGIGIDWKVKHPLTLGVAGDVQASDIESSDALQPNTNKGWVPKSVDTYSTLDEMSLVGFDNLTLTLIKMKGNFFLPTELLKANGLPAIVVNTVAQNIKGVVQNLGLEEVKSFYTSSETTQQIAAVSTVSFTGGSPVAKSMATIVITGGRIQNFRTNMFVDIYDSTGATKRNTGVRLMVTYVDRVKKTIKVADPTGLNALDALAGGAIATTDLIVRNKSYGKGLMGLDSWTKASGTIMGVSLDAIPDLKSFIAAVSGILTESVLNNAIGDYCEAYGPKMLAGVTTHGALNKHRDDLVTFNTSQGMMQIQRQGAPLDRVTGFNAGDNTGGYGIVHHYGGMTVPIYASAHQISGQLNIMQVGEGNIKRYSPARVRGMGSHEAFGSDVEFALAYENGGNIFGNVPVTVPGTSQIAASNMYWAPFYWYVNRMALNPQGIKLTGLTELSALTYS